jgi:FixJ family two-component response regulator
MKPVVHVVDDDASFLRAIARLLTLSGHTVATFASATEFLERRDPASRGCVIVDLRMPGHNGLELQAALERGANPLPVIFLTGHGNIAASVHAMKRGAEDFLTKPVRKEELLDAVKRALIRDEESFARREHLRQLRCRYDGLTPREREVLAAIVSGRLNKEIAAEIGATERTVKAHRASIMAKMGAGSPAELGTMAATLGLLPPATQMPV